MKATLEAVTLGAAMLVALVADGFAQPVPAPFPVPADISFRKATISSEGTRMAAEVFAPAAAGQKLPTIIMAHGWGGTAAQLRADAVAFAQAGYLVVTFDYRGWGESDSRVILTAPPPAARSGNRFTAEVLELREIVDPLAMAADWFNAVHWVQAEPQSDTSRIGLWGSSFAGGLVVYVAGHDRRVKAVHSQVGALDFSVGLSSKDRNLAYDEATRRARGELGYPKPGEVVIGSLRGAPIRDHFLSYSPAEAMNLAPDCALQIVLAGNEELFDNRLRTINAYEAFKGTKKNLVIVPGITHYGIYGKARVEAQKLALDWFNKQLKP
jgi:pimeloyl-ACP methyl ester carboxylesterase